jgi:hypothetical protein
MKRSETHQNMSLGSNGVDRACSLRKNSDVVSLHELVHKLHKFGPFCIDLRAVTKRSKTHQNMSLGSNEVDRFCWLRKILMRLSCTNLCTNCSSSGCFALIYVRWRNGRKSTKTWVQGPKGWTGCVRYEKFQHDFIGRICPLIAPVRPILHRFLCCDEMVRNAPKHDFRVQWGGSGAFIVKNSKTTSLHELVH